MASVNQPTNPKLKEQDINAKLQLYGIYSAFANGKVPSNKQIDVAMNSVLASKPLSSPSKKLSTEGQALVGDLRKVIEQAKVLLLTKNDGNLIQDFVWQTQHIGGASTPNAPIDKGTAKQHGNQALEGLRTLGELIITNGQFRKLLSDGVTLLRDMAGDAAQKSANKLKPSDDELNNIDEPAEDNTWHETPDLSKDSLRNQAKSRLPIGKKDLQDAAGDATQAAHPDGSRDPAEAADLAAQDQQKGTDSGVDAKEGARTGLSNLKDKVSGNTDDETKDQAREKKDQALAKKDRANDYLKSKMPKERQDQIIHRLKKMVVEIQGHPDYQQAIDTLLRLAEEYQGHAKNVAKQSHGTVKDARDQDSLQLAEGDLKTLLERFANGTSFDDLSDSVDQIYRDADRDPELKSWFSSVDRYIRKCLKEQGYILKDSSNEEWNQIYDKGNFLLRDRYRNHTDRIADEFKFIGDQFDKDPQNNAFANSLNKLFTDLGTDDNGKTTFKPHLLKDLTEVILPGLFETIRYVPIPRIEYSDPMMDAVVENLVIESDNLAPNVLEFGSDNYWRWGRKSIQNKNKNKVMLSVSGVQMDLRDVSYYVKKKEGFPGVTDKGVMDIFLGGTGLSFKVAMETADKSDNAHFFKINTVVVDIKNMNIKLKQSNHKLLFGLFKPLLFKVLRPVIQKVVEKQIRENIQKVDALLFKVKKEADRAQAEAMRNPDPENLQNMYQRYFSAFQQQMSKAQEKKDEGTGDKQVNVAVTQHDSIFPQVKLPGGISSKATEYKDLAAKGDRWESPVFSMGSSSESRNLPKVTQVSRKPHDVTEGGVRGETGLDSEGITQGKSTGQSQGQGYDGEDYERQGQGYGEQEYGQAQSTGNGFASQVNNAFQGDKQDYGLGSGTTNNGSTFPTGDHTFLGKNNPVFQGSV